MRIDVSADSFNATHAYSRVLLQQGRPILDRDWNEHTAIVQHQLRALTRAIFGSHGGLAGGKCGFVLTLDKGVIRLRKGDYSIDGVLVTCETDMNYEDQSFKPAKMEPHKAYLVYLEAIEREVVSAECPHLLDAALPGVDVAARGQIVWRVNHADWPGDPKNTTGGPASSSDATDQANQWFHAKGDSCESPNLQFPEELKAKMRGLAKSSPNQLLRAEYHSNDIWKVCSDNASALFKLADQENQLTEETAKINFMLGVLDSWAPRKGKLVELLTEQALRFNEPGELFQVDEVTDSDGQSFDDIDRRTITLSKTVKPDSGYRFLRVWDSQVTIAHDGRVMPGDYWMFPNRGTALPFEDAEMRRPTRLFAPLALVRTDKAGTPLPEIQRFQRVVGPQWRDICDLDVK